jgi:hypothetical protein
VDPETISHRLVARAKLSPHMLPLRIGIVLRAITNELRDDVFMHLNGSWQAGAFYRSDQRSSCDFLAFSRV